MAHDVFISYAADDKKAADAICAILEAERIRCWIAPRDILPGTKWAEAIAEAMHGARVLVVVFSSNANRSEHVFREAELAVKRRIPILPIRLEEVLPSDALSYYLAGQHWLDALTPPLEASIRRLAEAVRILLSGRSPPSQGADLVEPRTGMEFVCVPGGSFEMGDVFGDGQPNEGPARLVDVATFLIGRYPVTQHQWETVMRSNPSRAQGPKLPVTNVSWIDAQEFISALNDGGPGGYRLPTEAEWEYAARSGGKKRKWAGKEKAGVAAVAWTYANSQARLHPVGGKEENDLGLYDMSGNVWEWCSDRYREAVASPGGDGPEEDLEGADIRVYRGGSWINPPGDARCSYRGNGHATGRASSVGFRLARTSG